MKKVRNIITIKNWMDKLYFVLHDFFYTDLVMHKQGVIYEKEIYQKKTIARLKSLFDGNILDIVKKNEYEELMKELKKPQEKYSKILREDKEKWLGKKKPLRVYIPEKDTESSIFVHHLLVCKEILEKIKSNKIEKIDLDIVLEKNIEVLRDGHESFREELQNYGYIIKKEKKVKYLGKKEKKVTKIKGYLSMRNLVKRLEGKMRRAKRINTIKDWMDSLHFIFYNFFYTDLLMHKQGAIYDKYIYQRKTEIRLKFLLYKLRIVMKKNDHGAVSNAVKNQEEMYLKKYNKEYEECLGKEKVYIPEKAVEDYTSAMYFQLLFKLIVEKIKTKKLNKTEIHRLVSVSTQVLSMVHEDFRKELKDYGYIVKKEKQQIYFRK